MEGLRLLAGTISLPSSRHLGQNTAQQLRGCGTCGVLVPTCTRCCSKTRARVCSCDEAQGLWGCSCVVSLEIGRSSQPQCLSSLPPLRRLCGTAELLGEPRQGRGARPDVQSCWNGLWCRAAGVGVCGVTWEAVSADLTRLRQLLGGRAAVPPLHEALTANLIFHASLVLPAHH